MERGLPSFASRFAMPLPIPVGAVGQSLGHWRNKLGRAAPMSAVVAAMFALDNVYEWRNWTERLAVDLTSFGRSIFRRVHGLRARTGTEIEGAAIDKSVNRGAMSC